MRTRGQLRGPGDLDDRGSLRVTAFDDQGTFNENGGTLILPEPAATSAAAWLALALVARRARRRRCTDWR